MGREGNTVWPPNSIQEKCLFFYAERTSQVKVFTFEFSTVGQFVGIQVESEETSKEESQQSGPVAVLQLHLKCQSVKLNMSYMERLRGCRCWTRIPMAQCQSLCFQLQRSLVVFNLLAFHSQYVTYSSTRSGKELLSYL